MGRERGSKETYENPLERGQPLRGAQNMGVNALNSLSFETHVITPPQPPPSLLIYAGTRKELCIGI